MAFFLRPLAGMAQIIDHPGNAGYQGFLAESDLLIPHLPVASIGRPMAAARYAVSAEIAKTEMPRGVSTSADFIRTGHEGGPRRAADCRECRSGRSPGRFGQSAHAAARCGNRSLWSHRNRHSCEAGVMNGASSDAEHQIRSTSCHSIARLPGLRSIRN